MTVYAPISYCAELKPAFKGKLTWKVADTLQYLPLGIYQNSNEMLLYLRVCNGHQSDSTEMVLTSLYKVNILCGIFGFGGGMVNTAHHFCISIIARVLIYGMCCAHVFHIEIYQRGSDIKVYKKGRIQQSNILNIDSVHAEGYWKRITRQAYCLQQRIC